MRSKLAALAVGGVLIIGTSAGVTAFHSSGSTAGPPSVALSVVETMIPGETLSDWATFGDHLVVATVASQRELPASAEDLKSGEGFIPREITLRIDQVLWSRDQALPAPESFDTQIDGWVFHGDQRTPMRPVQQPMMEVGTQFVLPIMHWSATDRVSEPGWSILSRQSIIPYQDGVLGQGDVIPSVAAFKGHRTDTTRQRFIGKTPAQLVAALDRAPLLPGASGGMALPPDLRVQYIREHRP